MVVKKSTKIGGVAAALLLTVGTVATLTNNPTPKPPPKVEAATASKQAERLSLLPPGQPTCVYLDIAAINLHRIACPGGSPEIDAGQVAMLMWIKDARYFAAHRTTYGASFNKVPSLKVGDIITVRDTRVTSYRVAEVITIRTVDIYGEIAKPEWGPTKPVALQTSHPLGPDYRYLVVAKQI